MKIFTLSLLIIYAQCLWAMDFVAQEKAYQLNLVKTEFNDHQFFLSEYLKCKNQMSESFKPQIEKNILVISGRKFQIHKRFEKCLEYTKSIYPNELRKLLTMETEFEQSIMNKVRNVKESEIFENVEKGFKFKNCSKDLKELFPKVYLFSTQKQFEKKWVIETCEKYEHLL